MKFKKTAILCFVFLLQASGVWAQVGGRRSFGFLEQPAGARLAALGSANVSSPGSDASMLQANPALLQAPMENRLTLSYTDYLADISMGSVFYALEHKRYGRWGAGILYQNFGNFKQTDPTGQVTGPFSVQNYVLHVTHAKTIEPFTLGATLKLALSGIAEYKSIAALLDIGGVYQHPEKELYVGIALKNIGYQLKTFDGSAREPMPLDVQIGASYKPEHMPLRFSITAHQLQQFNIVYLDTAQSGNLGFNPTRNTFGEKIARHFVIGTEILFNKNVSALLGYNHLRRQELRLETKSGGAGLSLGASVRIKKFEIVFTRAYYHVAGASNGFTIISNVNQVFRKKASS